MDERLSSGVFPISDTTYTHAFKPLNSNVSNVCRRIGFNLEPLRKNRELDDAIKAGSINNTSSPEFEPFKQGQLDCLCGLYAIFNAINLASGEETIDQYEASFILSTIMPMAIELASTPKDGFIGLSGDELELLAKVIFHGVAMGGPEFSLQKPQRHLCELDEKHLSKTQIFRRTKSRPNCALIVRVKAKSSFHWSVFLNRQGKHIELFDSAHCDAVHIKHCRPWRLVNWD